MSGDDVFTDDDTANAEDRMRQAEYGTVRDWNGKPSTPSPLPDETPFSLDAERASRPSVGETALREALEYARDGFERLAEMVGSGTDSWGLHGEINHRLARLRAALAAPVPADDRP